MNSDTTLDTVFARDELVGQIEALRTLLNSAMARASALTDPPERRQAEMTTLIAFKDMMMRLVDMPPPPGCADPVSFAPRRVQLLCAGTDEWVAALERMRGREQALIDRREYEEQRCGDPAFRSADHGPLSLLEASPRSLVSPSGRQYDFADVAPYVEASGNAASRESAYRRWVGQRQMLASDLRDPSEFELIGQRGLFAAADIPAGTCVGVYGGLLLDEVGIFLTAQTRYLLTPPAIEGRRCSINGEGLIALANTLFVLDADGKPCGHPAQGYNMEAAQFEARFSHGWRLPIPAFFTTEDVPAGTELRWNYRLQPR